MEVCDLIYSKASALKSRWVLCVPEASPVTRPEQLAGKRVATELVGTVRRYFATRNIPITVEFSWGATEMKVPDLVDAIVDIDRDRFLAPGQPTAGGGHAVGDQHEADRQPGRWANPAKRRKIETIALLLRGALEAERKVGLK